MNKVLVAALLAVLGLGLLMPLVNCSSSESADSQSGQGQFKEKGDSANWWVDEAKTTLDWEAEKREKEIPTDTIVIHHTAMSPGITLQDLSDVGYKRLYVPRFNPTIPDPHIPSGTRIQSGHFRESEEVFYGYHWLIRDDGTKERLLEDHEVAWSAGSWQVNMQAIAICFDGDFSGTSPSDEALAACGELIADYMESHDVRLDNITGHFDYRATECPGSWFGSGGKEKILKYATG